MTGEVTGVMIGEMTGEIMNGMMGEIMSDGLSLQRRRERPHGSYPHSPPETPPGHVGVGGNTRAK